MNKTLLALLKKLTWKLNDIRIQVNNLQQEFIRHEEALNVLKDQLNQATEIPAFILPEREISRMNFLLKIQNEIHEMELKKQNIQADKKFLMTKEQRLQMEIKSLEKYQENQQTISKKKLLKNEEMSMNEWAAMNKENA